MATKALASVRGPNRRAAPFSTDAGRSRPGRVEKSPADPVRDRPGLERHDGISCYSMRQAWSQPSPLVKLPSSHCSSQPICPSPQRQAKTTLLN